MIATVAIDLGKVKDSSCNDFFVETLYELLQKLPRLKERFQ